MSRDPPIPTTWPQQPSLRCAVYVRVSVDERLDSAMPSVAVQDQACRAFIEARRHQGWEAIESVYEDSGYSGGNLDRPALRRLLGDMASDRVEVVVVHRLDRLSRSMLDLCILLPLFTIPGIRLVSVTQPLDSATPEGRLNLHLLTSFAPFQRELIGERTREKLAATRAKGLWQGTGAPLGYRADYRQRLVAVDPEAGMVPEHFSAVPGHELGGRPGGGTAKAWLQDQTLGHPRRQEAWWPAL